ncbi:MAG: hypothetical protein COX41_04450 [Candidatus Omnitrophica bacterium CG23_combo_of_CG06-09_8_20_14_all_41_10]|uniref:Aspartate ammonia-lyase n=1 Tax=Candidatus Sherwoodlollariibacterium unditelluris TaxID=1974757 RepID=A0A2G9YIZ4_9BACT|nr:MAG: hypothetical protein COX41_04450 [Candidatus Omnitrophica bacterium CG23_combo_of_CG06-09_8_20_14_all_41_10]
MKLKNRADSQLSSMAGEFLTAGKLFKHNYQVSITMGNAKAIDLLVHNPKTGKTFSVQVKALRQKNCFPIKKENIKPDHVYVFIILNATSPTEDYYILKGETILQDINRFFGTSYTREKPSSVPAINYGPLSEFKDNWRLFDE